MRSWLEVLIVSSNFMHLYDLAEWIMETGVEPRLCSSVSEAQRILQSFPNCLVFSDVTLPDGDFRDIVAILAGLGIRIPVAVYSPLEGRTKSLATLREGTCLATSSPYSKEDVERLIAALVVPGRGLTN